MLRDGKFWAAAGSPHGTGENYDLAVVGGGISGLAAAYFYTRQNPSARVLVLDNKYDFGGHAMRDEFTPVVAKYGRLIIGYRGTQSIDHPHTFSSQATGLLNEIGIELKRFYKYYDQTFYERLGLVNSATFFPKETWGSDYLAIQTPKMSFADLLKGAPHVGAGQAGPRHALPRPQGLAARPDAGREVREAEPDHLRGVADGLRQGGSRRCQVPVQASQRLLGLRHRRHRSDRRVGRR